MTAKLEPTEFHGGDLLTVLKNRGFNVYVEQTGGNCATFMVTQDGSNERVLIGPGSFDWSDPNKSVFTTDELAIGADLYNVDDTEKDHDPDSVYVQPMATMEEIADVVVAVWEDLK